ncbi:MAG: hypothetical protein AB1468_02965 [Candidatus Micrarchaeota archaeon]
MNSHSSKNLKRKEVDSVVPLTTEEKKTIITHGKKGEKKLVVGIEKIFFPARM